MSATDADTVVTNQSELRTVYREPRPRAAQKVLDHLDVHCRNFIEMSPFCVLSTTGTDGRADASPRGDPPGFVKVLDDRTLLIPDRPGNNLMVMSVLSRTILPRELARNWALVYVGNLIGSLVIVLLVFYSRWWEQGDFSFSDFSVTSANGKVNLPFEIAFLRGIVANMLVCLGVWMATAGRTVTDKLLAVFLPVTAFVAGGFEHSVANMFFLPFGAMVATDSNALEAAGLTPADVSRLDFGGIVQNLVAVTMGNVVGGVIVGLAVWTVHLRRRAVAAAASARGEGAPGA